MREETLRDALPTVSIRQEPSGVKVDAASPGWIRQHSRVLWPVAVGVVFVICWQTKLFHDMFGLAEYQLPLPLNIVQTMDRGGCLLHDRDSRQARPLMIHATMGEGQSCR